MRLGGGSSPQCWSIGSKLQIDLSMVSQIKLNVSQGIYDPGPHKEYENTKVIESKSNKLSFS